MHVNMEVSTVPGQNEFMNDPIPSVRGALAWPVGRPGFAAMAMPSYAFL